MIPPFFGIHSIMPFCSPLPGQPQNMAIFVWQYLIAKLINILSRSVVFEKLPHTGDRRLTGRFGWQSNKPPGLKSTTFRRVNNEYK